MNWALTSKEISSRHTARECDLRQMAGAKAYEPRTMCGEWCVSGLGEASGIHR